MAEKSIDKELIIMVKNTFMRFIYNNTVFNTVQVEFGTYYLFVLRCFPVLFTGDRVNCFGQVQPNTEECQTLQTTLFHCCAHVTLDSLSFGNFVGGLSP